MKIIRDCPNKPVANRHSQCVVKKLKIQTITPIMGAGAISLSPDRNTYVRGGTIRGLLRYWWRSTQFNKTLEELTKAENELFGQASSPGQLVVTIRNMQQSGSNDSNIELPQYVSFPIPKGQDHAQVCTSCSFTLILEYPEKYEDQIDNAVWAWANFGGIGMRTRRGAGALRIEGYTPSTPSELKGKLVKICGEDLTQPEWSLLSSRLWWGRTTTRPREAWDEGLRKLAQFRQYPHGRPERRKRSLWPEADSLRRITGISVPEHKTSITGDNDAFPRAELGLPLIVKFKDRGEPSETSIYPIEGGRRPSPIIIKPLALQSGDCVPIVLIMSAPPLKGIRLNRDGKTYGPEHLRGDLVKGYDRSPLRKFNANNAIDAYEIMLKKERWVNR
jgi:CRISPR-associated protein Cmr1